MLDIQRLKVEIEREEDGRILASIPELPGVIRATEDQAVRKAKSIALGILADIIENGEEVPDL